MQIQEGDYTLTSRCHHQNDSCIKMGSDESRFNVSLIVRGKVTRQCPQNTSFEEKGEKAEAESNRGPSDYQPNALPLGQTGSQVLFLVFLILFISQLKARDNSSMCFSQQGAVDVEIEVHLLRTKS